MENLIVITAMLLLCFKAKDKRLLLLIAVSCGVLQLAYEANIDIALYYGVCAVVSIVSAFVGLRIETTSSRAFCVLMLIQSALCLFAVPDWHYTGNLIVQYVITQFNDTIVFILIALGVAEYD